MEELIIKEEYEQTLCRLCLSVDRTLVKIGDYFKIYQLIIPQVDMQDSKMLVCWECRAILRKLVQFQTRVETANRALLTNQFLIGSLSSLTNIALTSYDSTIPMDTPIDNDSDGWAASTDWDADIHESIDDKKNKQDIEPEIEVKAEPIAITRENDVNTKKSRRKVNKDFKEKPKKHKWAMEKALQNKQPKFKIVNLENMKAEFNLIKLDCVDLHKRSILRCRCDVCHLYFQNKLGLKNHMKWHDSSQPFYACDICNRTETCKKSLAKHMKKHRFVYVCRVCRSEFHTKNKWHRHAGRHTRVYECLQCSLQYEKRRDFTTHYKEWHEKFICEHCGVSFKLRYCIEKHMRKVHSPRVCTVCNKQFQRRSALWYHTQLAHPAPQPAYCVECDARFPTLYKYKLHLATSVRHSPKKKVSVPCPGCEKVFSKKCYMKEHYNFVHLNKFNHRCEPCDKNFLRGSDLREHNRRVHEGIPPPKNKICTVCGRAFSVTRILENHMRTHTGERPFACACGAAFAQSVALQAHRRKQHRGCV